MTWGLRLTIGSKAARPERSGLNLLMARLRISLSPDAVLQGPNYRSGTLETAKRRKLVVMLSCDGFDRGGIGRWVSYVFAAWNGAPGAPPILMIDTRARSGGVMPSIFAFARALALLVWLCLTGRVAIVHANVADGGSTVRKYIASEIAHLFGIPVVAHLHSGRYEEFYRGLPAWGRRAVRRLFNQAAKVIVLGQIWATMAEIELGVPRSKIMLLFNGVSRPNPGLPWPRPDGPCHIVMLARLGPAKGVDELMDALGSALLRPLQWRATLAGNGSATYERDAAARGIADRVSFPGWVGSDAAERLLAEADILVLPSHFECMPVSVLEAMAHGVAVVTTPVGAIPEIIADAESGLLVPVGDPAALAVALKRLIEDADLRRRLGSGGFAVFERELDVRQSARRLIATYDAILASKSSAR